MSITKTFVDIDTSSSFSNPTRTEENGEVSSITVNNLNEDTQYYVRAGVIQNGNTIYSTNTDNFTTRKNWDYFYIKNETSGTQTFTLKKNGSPTTGTDLSYSKNKTSWTQFDLTQTTNTVSLSGGQKLYLRSTTGFSQNSSKYYKISFSDKCSVGGHISSLLDYRNVNSITTIPNYSFKYLLSEITYLQDISDLDFSGISVIGNYSLHNCFYKCTRIQTPPDFSGIVEIKTGGISQCFEECGGLTTPPDFSSLTTIGEQGMSRTFYKSGLVTAPNLDSVTVLDNNALDSTFYYCSNLTSIASLNGINTINDYALYRTYFACSNLTTADLSHFTSIGTKGLDSTFYGCYLLSTIYAPNVSSWDTTKTSDWLYLAGRDSTSVKIFYAPAGLSIPTSNSGIPSGYNRIDY